MIYLNDYVGKCYCIFLSMVILNPNQHFQYYVGTLVVLHHDFFLSNSMKKYWYMHQLLSFIKTLSLDLIRGYDRSQSSNPKPTTHNQQNTTHNRKSYIALAEK